MRNVEIVNCEPEGSERTVIAIERGETEDGHPTMIVHVIEPGRSAKIGVRSGVELSLSDSMPKLVAVAEFAEDHAPRDNGQWAAEQVAYLQKENQPALSPNVLPPRDETPVTEDGEASLVFDGLGGAPVEGPPVVDAPTEAPEGEVDLGPIPTDGIEPNADPVDGQSDIEAGVPYQGGIVQ